MNANELRKRNINDNADDKSLSHPVDTDNSSTTQRKPKRESSFIRSAIIYGIPAVILCFIYGYNPLSELRLAYGELTGRYPLYTLQELETANAADRPLLVAVGRIFDVTRGKKHYIKGAAYSGFCGKDGSRAFATGDFSASGFTDDLTGLLPSQCKSISDWVDFYVKDHKYPEVGKLIGRFYDAKGHPTVDFEAYQNCVNEGLKEIEEQIRLKQLFPSCNSKWAQATGGEVWCNTDAEGLERVPRLLKGGKGRCSCYTIEYALAHQNELEVYKDCNFKSSWCKK